MTYPNGDDGCSKEATEWGALLKISITAAAVNSDNDSSFTHILAKLFNLPKS